MSDLLPIGQFAQISRLTTRALRFYDELDLLKPAFTDSATGYRYYRSTQIVVAERIRVLRELEVPLEDIRTLLGEPGQMGTVLEEHKRRLKRRQGEIVSLLKRLEDFMEEKTMSYEVSIKELAAQPIVFIRDHVVLPETNGVIRRAMEELFAYINQSGLGVAGACYCAYPVPQEGETVPVDSVVPVQWAVSSGRIEAGEQPAGTVAFTIHRGPYHDLPKAFQAVHAWVDEHGYEVTGALREIYLEDGEVPITEVAFPVRKRR